MVSGEERAGCFALLVFLVSRCCCVALPRGVTGLSAVCDCGISRSYSLSIFHCVSTSLIEGFNISTTPSQQCSKFAFYRILSLVCDVRGSPFMAALLYVRLSCVFVTMVFVVCDCIGSRSLHLPSLLLV